MKSLLYLVAGGVLALLPSLAAQSHVILEILRIPDGGIQPRVEIGPSGTIHLVYFQGNPMEGDVFYVKRQSNSDEWSHPIQVNHRPGSAIAAGTIRGPQMALGRGERVHVAWMGSGKVSTPAKEEGKHPTHPMLYTRLTNDRSSFEPERDVLTWTAGLDGGGTVAADGEGHVYVAWHGKPAHSSTNEYGRAVYVTHSANDGKSFDRETQANPHSTGACGCCGMRGFADSRGRLHLLYRMADEVNRDMGHLISENQSRSFALYNVSPWQTQTCPMSSAAFAEGPAGILLATETEAKVDARLLQSKSKDLTTPSGIKPGTRNGKHPSIAINSQGDTLFVWSEGAGWKRGGTLKWELHDKSGQLLSTSGLDAKPIPEWSFCSAVNKADDSFVIVY